jgi:hypothetical protein
MMTLRYDSSFLKKLNKINKIELLIFRENLKNKK